MRLEDDAPLAQAEERGITSAYVSRACRPSTTITSCVCAAQGALRGHVRDTLRSATTTVQRRTRRNRRTSYEISRVQRALR
jgi:hypothetical protein